jgi:hypothetical protein
VNGTFKLKGLSAAIRFLLDEPIYIAKVALPGTTHFFQNNI